MNRRAVNHCKARLQGLIKYTHEAGRNAMEAEEKSITIVRQRKIDIAVRLDKI
jgi:hypothetical protein